MGPCCSTFWVLQLLQLFVILWTWFLFYLLQDASYPTVALYPAQNKHAPIIFKGAAEVCSLHQFISRYGRASAKLRSKFSGFLLQMTSCLGVSLLINYFTCRVFNIFLLRILILSLIISLDNIYVVRAICVKSWFCFHDEGHEVHFRRGVRIVLIWASSFICIQQAEICMVTWESIVQKSTRKSGILRDYKFEQQQSWLNFPQTVEMCFLELILCCMIPELSIVGGVMPSRGTWQQEICCWLLQTRVSSLWKLSLKCQRCTSWQFEQGINSCFTDCCKDWNFKCRAAVATKFWDCQSWQDWWRWRFESAKGGINACGITAIESCVTRFQASSHLVSACGQGIRHSGSDSQQASAHWEFTKPWWCTAESAKISTTWLWRPGFSTRRVIFYFDKGCWLT